MARTIILFYAALKFSTYKITLSAFKKHSLWIKFTSKNVSLSEHFIYIYRGFCKVGTVFKSKNYKLSRQLSLIIFKIG